MALPSPSVHCSMTCHGLRPRYVSARSPCRVFRCWLPVDEHLGLVRLWRYFGAQSLHLRLADHPLPSGSTGSVTLPCAEFRAGPVVSLWPGWFIQLAYLGFPWRTHRISLYFAMQSTPQLYTSSASDHTINTKKRCFFTYPARPLPGRRVRPEDARRCSQRSRAYPWPTHRGTRA